MKCGQKRAIKSLGLDHLCVTAITIELPEKGSGSFIEPPSATVKFRLTQAQIDRLFAGVQESEDRGVQTYEEKDRAFGEF